MGTGGTETLRTDVDVVMMMMEAAEQAAMAAWNCSHEKEQVRTVAHSNPGGLTDGGSTY